jgi:hypothetical protein
MVTGDFLPFLTTIAAVGAILFGLIFVVISSDRKSLTLKRRQ